MSEAIVEGLNTCYYPLLEVLDAPQCSARRVFWIEGERLAFGLFGVPAGYDEPEASSKHKSFAYMICGNMRARVGRESRRASAIGRTEQEAAWRPDYQMDLKRT